MAYLARYVDSAARSVVERVIDAPSLEDACAELRRAGHVVVAVRPVGQARGRLRRRIDLRSFCLEFRSLLSAGLGVVESLEALAATQSFASQRDAMARVLDLVRQGKPLSSALEAAQDHFPALFRAAVRAGEAAGNLVESLTRFAAYLETMAKLRQSVIGAAIYPAVVIAFGTLVTLFLMGYVVPRFAAAFADLPQGRSGATSSLLTVATFLGAHYQLVLAGLLGLAWLGWRGLQSEGGRHRALGLVLKAGPIARGVRAYSLARMFRTQSMMLQGGYTLPEAIGLSIQVVAGTPWAEGLVRAERLVRQGKPIGASYTGEGLTTELTARYIAAGERSGQLAAMLEHAAEHHERELAWLVERASRIVEPLLLIVVALMIGAIVFLMYMPIFDLVSGFG